MTPLHTARRWLSVCLGIFLGVVSMNAAAIDPGTVKGKLTYKGEDYPLKHVYAWQPPGQAKELWVYLTDTELPAAAAQDRLQPGKLAAENRFRGVKLRLNPTKPNLEELSFVRFASMDDGMDFGIAAPRIWQHLGVGDKRVVGKLKYEASDDTSVDVEFNAPVFGASGKTQTLKVAIIETDMIVPEDWPVMLAIGGVGLVVLVVGYIRGSRRRALSRVEVTTHGRVVRLQKTTDIEDGRTSVSYDPVVEFVSSGGATHRFIWQLAPNNIGSTVTVRYDPQNPSTARIPGVMNSVDLWLGTVLIWLSGLGLWRLQ